MRFGMNSAIKEQLAFWNSEIQNAKDRMSPVTSNAICACLGVWTSGQCALQCCSFIVLNKQ